MIMLFTLTAICDFRACLFKVRITFGFDRASEVANGSAHTVTDLRQFVGTDTPQRLLALLSTLWLGISSSRS